MNKYRSARLASDELVVTEAEKNTTSINKIPAFAEGIAKLKSNNTRLRAAMLKQSQSTGGATTNKDIAREELENSMIEVASGIHSYAIAKNNNILKAKVEFTISEIERMRYSDLITTASSLLELAGDVEPEELAHYGIGADEVAQFGIVLKAFDNLKTSPKEATIEHSGYTETVASIQADSQLILDMLDKLAVQFRRKDPAYYDIYVVSRKINGTSPRRKKDDDTDDTSAEK